MRTPVGLVATTKDLKDRCERVADALTAIAQQKDPIFADPRSVMLELTLAIHELEAASWLMKRAWWP